MEIECVIGKKKKMVVVARII